jgi:Fur family transcriptional regulator, ferric uptake regulator
MPRLTRQKNAILRTLGSADRPLSPREILRLSIKGAPGLGIATVYRMLRRLLGGGELTCVQIPGCPPRYELCGRSHHHYFRCRSCRSIFNVEGCTGNFQALTPRGFRLEDHELVLYGLCGRCSGSGGDKGKGKPPRRRR